MGKASFKLFVMFLSSFWVCYLLFYKKGLSFFHDVNLLISCSFLGLVNGFTAYSKGFGNVVGKSLAVFPIKVADGDADGSLFG